MWGGDRACFENPYSQLGNPFTPCNLPSNSFLYFRRSGDTCETFYEEKDGCDGLSLDVDNREGGIHTTPSMTENFAHLKVVTTEQRR